MWTLQSSAGMSQSHHQPHQPWHLAAQRPTATNLRIRSTDDAHKIFYAVRNGVLRMVTRRLDADERAALGTGCVYAWEERSPNTEITGLGIERFTEGRRWSPSRVRDEFLFYYEKYVPPDPAHTSNEPVGWDQLVKQTYSVWVETEKGRRKWHLTAYFTQATVDRLGTVDDIRGVRGLNVPSGMFTSTRVSKNRAANKNAESDAASQSTVTRTYAPFPTPSSLVPLAPRPAMPGPPVSSSLTNQSPSSPSVQMYEPYPRPRSQSYPTYYSPCDVQSYPPSPASSQLAPLHSVSPEQYPMSPPGQPSGYTHQDGSDPHHSEFLGHPAVTVPTDIPHDRLRLPTPYSSVVQYPAQPPPPAQAQVQTQMQAHYTSGGWYTSPMSAYPPRAPSPRSDDTSSTPSSSPASLPPFSAYASLHLDYAAAGLASAPVGPSAFSLPRLQIPEDPFPAVLLSDAERRGEIGACRDLTPLNSLTRAHPYRRDPTDEWKTAAACINFVLPAIKPYKRLVDFLYERRSRVGQGGNFDDTVMNEAAVHMASFGPPKKGDVKSLRPTPGSAETEPDDSGDNLWESDTDSDTEEDTDYFEAWDAQPKPQTYDEREERRLEKREKAAAKRRAAEM
ncbi:hypothetical protein B0H10DRAFT_2231990 [Mycena sp. CBHHK59/15]|nr:hypothetical protein B0H10DRAFT_2231990 [Mycena sp. CBHHK59/15]